MNAPIERVPVDRLRHIEGFSKKRVDWLADKILAEGVWTKPVALDADHNLVLDGQHRMETAKRLGLKWVPAVRYDYAAIEVWSLRPEKHQFDWKRVTERALAGEPYPYKTVKHRFPDGGLPEIAVPLAELMADSPEQRAERRAAPKPARIPSGDRSGYSTSEGLA